MVSENSILQRVNNAFSPFHPISLREFFAGRIEQIGRIQRAISAPGQHIILYGDRGVGKTSLANIVPYLAERKKVFFHRCSAQDDYTSIFGDFIRRLESEMIIVKKAETHSSDKDGKLKLGIVEGRLKSEKMTETTYKPIQERRIEPGFIFETLKQHRLVLVIDEFDRVRNNDVNQKMADTIKALSDENSLCKIMIVGVAASVNELIGEHQSTARSLCQIQLQRMSKEELDEIICKGEAALALDLKFAPGAKRKIVNLSDGLPYYTQLLSYYSVIAWAQNKNAESRINEGDLTAGMSEAISNASETLRSGYERAIKTVKGKTQRFRNILWSFAMENDIDVQVQVIARNVSEIENKTITVLGFSYHLSELTKEQRGEVLTRITKGWYRFTDPLMRGYVRLQMEYDNQVHYGGQLVFAFMK